QRDHRPVTAPACAGYVGHGRAPEAVATAPVTGRRRVARVLMSPWVRGQRRADSVFGSAGMARGGCRSEGATRLPFHSNVPITTSGGVSWTSRMKSDHVAWPR